MYRLRVKAHFDAAHYIKDYKGKCSREHGHRWDIELLLAGTHLNDLNMLVDFVNVKTVLNHILDQNLDHYQLNESLGEPNLTAEWLASWLYHQVGAQYHKLNIESLPNRKEPMIVSVTIWESPECSIEYGPGGER